MRTLPILLLVSALGACDTGVRLRLEPATGTMPAVSLRACQPDGSACTDWVRPLDGTSGAARELYIADTDDTRRLALQLSVTGADGAWCQQVAVPLEHGRTVAVTAELTACGVTVTGCPACGAAAPCLDNGVERCEAGCRVAGACEGRMGCDGCGRMVPLCCAAGMTCGAVGADGIGSCS